MTITKPNKPNIIDTLSTGYTILHRNVWVLIIPIALNLYIWLGTKLSLAPVLALLRDKIAFVASLMASDPAQQEQIVVNMQNADMRMLLAWSNFVPLLPSSLLLQAGMHEHVMYVHNVAGAIASILAINLLALLISSVFLTILTNSLYNERCTVWWFVGTSVISAIRIASYLCVIAGLIVVVVMPFMLVLTLVALSFPQAAFSMITMLWFAVWFWVYLYTGFAIEAILISRVGPIKAIFHSIRLVRYNFLSTIGFLLITFIIISGLGIIWDTLSGNSIGLLLSMIGSAYIGSGLVSARLVFYQERVFAQVSSS